MTMSKNTNYFPISSSTSSSVLSLHGLVPGGIANQIDTHLGNQCCCFDDHQSLTRNPFGSSTTLREKTVACCIDDATMLQPCVLNNRLGNSDNSGWLLISPDVVCRGGTPRNHVGSCPLEAFSMESQPWMFEAVFKIGRKTAGGR